jgi:hypothetical protein
MTSPLKEVLSDGFAAPLGEVIASIGRGVADAQAALDRASLEATLAIYETEGDAGTDLLREIGYRPTFYVLPETTCEVQVSMRVGASQSSGGSAAAAPGAPALRARSYVTPVDAGFANRFGYEASASARLSFKIVPIPPPSALDEGRPVPALTGRTAEEAEAALGRLGLTASFVDAKGNALEKPPAGSSSIIAQSPAAITLIPIGGSVVLTVKG